jgi:hypothetical protein
VKPTKQQLTASREEQQTAKYLLGLKGKKTATMTTGASNRFKALEESAHIEEVDQPEQKPKIPEEPPSDKCLASVESDLYADPTATFTAATTDSAVPVADFLCRESFAWFDAARLPPFAIVHLKLTKGLDAKESANVMKSVGKDWAVCTSEIDADLKDRICYAYLQGWPLTKQDTRARIQEDTDQLGGFTDDSSAMRYGCMSLDEVTPHDYYRYHTKQTDRSTGIFFLTYPELTTAASLAEYLQKGGVERNARVAILRAMDIGLGGNSDGHALDVTSQRLVLLDLSVFDSLAFDRSSSRHAGNRPVVPQTVLNRLLSNGRSFVLC